MASSLRTLLILILAIPSVALPQGLPLDWCLCPGVLGSNTGPSCCAPSCCQTTCCEAPDSDPLGGREACDEDCEGCHSIEVDRVDPGIEPQEPELPAFVLVRLRGAADALPVVHARRVVHADGRAPPGAVRPPGLWPGVLPLRR